MPVDVPDPKTKNVSLPQDAVLFQNLPTHHTSSSVCLLQKGPLSLLKADDYKMGMSFPCSALVCEEAL